jgi:hypothetical protein
MKVSEWASAFVYGRTSPQPEWLATPASYTNRQVVQQAFSAVGPGWAGLAAARPELPEGVQVPHNPIQAVLGGSYLARARDMLREGG